MAEEENDSHRNRSPTARQRLAIAACLAIAAVAAILLLIGLRQRPGVEEQLRAIDVAHAIPDEENAARDYTKLVLGNVASSVIPQPMPEHIRATTRTLPWRSADYPQAVRWLEDHQATIEALLAAGRKPGCWFSASETGWHGRTHPRAMYEWSPLLLQVANNDLGEGRTEAGLEKLLCLLHMANHFLSQDHPWYYSVGMGMAMDGLSSCNRLVVLENVPPDWLARLEAALPPTQDTWAEKSRRLDEVADLYERGLERGIARRLAHTFLSAWPSESLRVFYLVHLSHCRAGHLLVTLRRHKDRTGAWPTSLSEIDLRVSRETSLDPFSGKPFGYRPAGDTFLLYSVGPNGTDEGGAPRNDRILWSH
jgi:hypothetical protein